MKPDSAPRKPRGPWFVVGTGIGAALGSATGAIAVWLALGVAIGLLFDAASVRACRSPHDPRKPHP